MNENKKFSIEIDLSEFLEDANNNIIYLKKFYEVAGYQELLEVLNKGYNVVKDFITNLIKKEHDSSE